MRPGVTVTMGLLLLVSACASGGPTANPTAPTPAGTPTGTASAPATPVPPAPTGSASPGSPSPGNPTGGSSQLRIVLDDGAGTTTTWTLTCDPPGGDHPDPAGACAAVEQHPTALQPVPKDRVCAQVFSGPERATVTGTWRGEDVFAVLSRINSCETGRWNALVPLVPAGGR